MLDMTLAATPKSDQLNYDDFIGGKTLTIKVTDVKLHPTVDQKTTINWEGDNGKPFKPGKSMVRVLIACWSKNGTSWIGRSMTLYGDSSVKFGPDPSGGVRISHVSDITETKNVMLTASKGKRKPFTVKPLTGTSPPPKPTDAAVKKAGDEAAALGVAEYTAWLGKLAPEAKETARAFSKEWTAVAREADRVKAETPQPAEDGHPIDNGEGDPEPE